MTGADVILPPLLHVPIREAYPAAVRTIVELRVLPDGTRMLPVYTDRARLLASCGDGQPWMLIPSIRLDALHTVLGFDQIMVNVELPELERRTTTEEGGNGW